MLLGFFERSYCLDGKGGRGREDRKFVTKETRSIRGSLVGSGPGGNLIKRRLKIRDDLPWERLPCRNSTKNQYCFSISDLHQSVGGIMASIAAFQAVVLQEIVLFGWKGRKRDRA